MRLITVNSYFLNINIEKWIWRCSQIKNGGGKKYKLTFKDHTSIRVVGVVAFVHFEFSHLLIFFFFSFFPRFWLYKQPDGLRLKNKYAVSVKTGHIGLMNDNEIQILCINCSNLLPYGYLDVCRMKVY